MAPGQRQPLIVCDLDGTLVDVRGRHHRVYRECVELLGGRVLDVDEYWKLKRRDVRWPELLPLSDIDAGELSRFLDAFRARIEAAEYLERDPLIPGAAEAVALLATHGTVILVSLRRDHAALRAQLGRLGLLDRFDEVLSGHSEVRGHDVKAGLIRDRASGRRSVIVGDTEADVRAGKAAGIQTVAVTSGIRDEAYLTALEPDALLPSIVEAADWIGERFSRTGSS